MYSYMYLSWFSVPCPEIEDCPYLKCFYGVGGTLFSVVWWQSISRFHCSGVSRIQIKIGTEIL